MSKTVKELEEEAVDQVLESIAALEEMLGEKASKAELEEIKMDVDELKTMLTKSSEEDQQSEKRITSQMTKINAAIEKQEKQLTEILEKQAKALENGGRGRSKAERGGGVWSKETTQSFIKLLFPDGVNGEKSQSMDVKMKLPTIAKAPESMLNSVLYTGAVGTVPDAFTGREVDPTLYQRNRKRNFILDNIPVTSISVPTLYYLEKIEIGTGTAPDNGAGSAAWIVSGNQKPLRSFRVTSRKVDAKKVAVFYNVDDKLIRDIASLENWIQEDAMDEMYEKYNDALLNNNPSVDANAPLGLKINAVQFAASAAFDELVPLPNFIDAIIAAAAYQATLKEQPFKAFVADDVFYAIHNLKATDGKYLNNNLVYTNAAGQLFIAGVEVVPCDNEDIPATHLMLISRNLGFVVKNYGPLVFERGLNGEDFRNDRTSFRAYQEVLSYIPENRENSVLYDTFANIFTAIELPAPTP
jgi:HK97 family phage major capsid protein